LATGSTVMTEEKTEEREERAEERRSGIRAMTEYGVPVLSREKAITRAANERLYRERERERDGENVSDARHTTHTHTHTQTDIHPLLHTHNTHRARERMRGQKLTMSR